MPTQLFIFRTVHLSEQSPTDEESIRAAESCMGTLLNRIRGRGCGQYPVDNISRQLCDAAEETGADSRSNKHNQITIATPFSWKWLAEDLK